MNIDTEAIDNLINGLDLKTGTELFGANGLVKQLIKRLVERALEAELEGSADASWFRGSAFGSSTESICTTSGWITMTRSAEWIRHRHHRSS